MTTSNGSCAGVLLPGLGVELNNMLGESDLHPLGHEAAEPGTRIGSMMAPTIWSDDEGDVVALGSGGSERIRSALLEVVVAYAVGGHDLAGAVGMPRVHPDDEGVLHVEPGHDPLVLAQLRGLGRVREWPERDFFFGGVHAVVRGPDGSVAAVADARRGGAARVVRR
jgi:gamma-glutamyltranspeptidase/glutathione hydrolase